MKKTILLPSKEIPSNAKSHLAQIVVGLLALVVVQAPSTQAQKYADWSAPVNLGAAVNSTLSDQGPAISQDGLTLYFHSNRTGGFGGFDIYVSQRTSVADEWDSPVNLGSILNSAVDEGNPAFSNDGLSLFFQSNRPGGLGGVDLWVSRRTDSSDDFDWGPAMNLGAGVNSTADDNAPSYFENNEIGVVQLYFVSSRTGGSGGQDIYLSNQTLDGSFGPAALVPELSSSSTDSRPSIRDDGLEIIFQSNRSGSLGTALDLWVASRISALDGWSIPVPLGDTINTTAIENNANLSSDRLTLFFSSDRPNGIGGLDLYVSTRPTPNWTSTGNLNVGRDNQTATLLLNGKVLVAGGNGSNGTLKSAELYDPATGTWSNTGNLNSDRAFHTATLLPNGKVLVAGGFSCAPPPASCAGLNSAELYDPASGIWSSTGNLSTARDGSHTSTLLSNGKVLLAGGFLGDGGLSEAELYDPATGTWNATGSLNTGRHSHTATLLKTGKVLVVGGKEFDPNANLNSTELYDPATGTWSSTGNLNTARIGFTATLLANGSVLVAGGFTDFASGQVTNSAELYDPATGTWSITGNLNTGRALHTATLLLSGKVLVAGGFNIAGGLPNILNGAELYDPATGTWSNTASLNIPRRFHTETLLLNGEVLVVGGSGLAANSAELYDPGTPGPNSVQLSAASYNASEGDGSISITFTRTGDTSGAATVNYATSDSAGLNNCNVVNGIASSRCDYITSVGTLRFVSGESSRTISIPLVDDAYAEGNESFTITLTNPSGATLGSASTATITLNDNEVVDGPNPLDEVPFFVRQQYVDFLNREPDPVGYAAWQAVINNCLPNDPTCDRIHVSSSFFRSPEFQGRGYFVYRFYPVAFGRKPDYDEFTPDLAKVSGFLSDAELEAAKVAFIADFMNRPAFSNTYNGLNNTQYVDTLLATAGITHPSRDFWIAALGDDSRTRAQVLREIAESTEVYNKYYNQAFVVMQYFGYLRRQPDGQYIPWIQHLDSTADYRSMINGFMNSTEYRARFGP